MCHFCQDFEEILKAPYIDLHLCDQCFADRNLEEMASCGHMRSIGTRRRRQPLLVQALIQAVQEGHSNCVRKLILAGANMNKADGCGNTALVMAATLGKESCLKILIQAGTDLNVANRQTALHLTVRYGHEKCLQALIQGGADVNVADIHGMTALHEALVLGKAKCVAALIQAGADVNIADKHGITGLMHAMIPVKNMPISAQCMKALLRAGARVNEIVPVTSGPQWFRTGKNAIDQLFTWTLIPCPDSTDKIIPMLLFAAGERPSNTYSLWIPDYIKELMEPKVNTLKELSLEAVRKSLLKASNVNLFWRIDKLGLHLPLNLQHDLLYGMSLDGEEKSKNSDSGDSSSEDDWD